ncbi:uncharacterized protein LOC110700830 [Chenopodium quinoa]|uniref:uncharacterized protein LOC110700830 n=1 Tax=Chenopodium quinoa TaxID=63459 RepID=UPI000B78DE6C|nr:uncharacterized protein LOC110700830 [Chenopodium quinoa]
MTNIPLPYYLENNFVYNNIYHIFPKKKKKKKKKKTHPILSVVRTVLLLLFIPTKTTEKERERKRVESMEKNKEIDSTEVDEEAALFINKNIEEIPEEELALKILFVSINPQKNNQSAIKEEKILLIPRNHINPVIFPFDFLSIDNGDYTNKKPTTFNFKVVHDEKRPFYSDDLDFFKNSKDGRWIEWCNHQGQTLILFRPFFKTKPDLDDYFCYDGCNKKCWISLGCPFLKFSRWPNITVSLRVSVVAQYLLGFFSELLSLRLPCEEEFGATGFSVGLVSTKNHQLEYDLTLLETTDLLSGNLRLGNLSLLSSLYYKFTIDERDSILRPTQGYAVQSATTISGLLPDGWSARFLRQVKKQKYNICFLHYIHLFDKLLNSLTL